MIVSVYPINKKYTDRIEKITGEKIVIAGESEKTIDVLAQAEIIIGLTDADTMRKCRKLKWLFVLSAGVEKLPLDYLRKHEITVTNVRGIHGTQMAEHTFGMMIIFSRRLNILLQNQAQRIWDNSIRLDELSGKTLCVIGAGSIGTEIARKAKAFDMKVIGISRSGTKAKYFDSVLHISDLHKALQRADYNVLITPLTDETFHMISTNEFENMKRGSYFINISRGDTVDEKAMILALQERKIAGAGLDVFHDEPLPAENPLWGMKNVIITPHNAGMSPHYMKRAIELFEQSLIMYRRGQVLPNTVDYSRQY